MPTVNPIGATRGASMHTGSAVQRTPKQEMDGELFMSLLVTQLKNQDPSSPMDTNQMLAQTTQLSMMEQITKLSATSADALNLQARSVAASLVGKLVDFTDASGTPTSGVVSKVTFTGNTPSVTIGDQTVPLDRISGLSQ